MTFSRALSVIVLGFSALSMGCLEGGGDRDGSEPAADLGAPSLSPQGWLNGAGGVNSLLPYEFHANRTMLYGATTGALATWSNTDKVWSFADNAFTDALLSGVGGQNTLKYAVKCALSATSSISVAGSQDDDDLAYTGMNILATTQSWKTAALSIDSADDLFTCMIAHLNANGVPVPINLSGPHIVNSGSSDPAFSWEEALFAAKIDTSDPDAPAFSVYVWPMDSLVNCPSYITGLSDRLCGTGVDNCGLIVRDDREEACTETGNGWYCDDLSGHPLPAVLTRLKSKDAEKFYPGCE